ncbi:hypothetical protein [Nocardia amikacinitolerans]|uniref:hypothetical protein n=1 Tax=Nocardia amikacinitolerans TaxID=756689 RepID=UPI000834BD9C|nr:hypothetical protein [Nocardia amikacinitolerans]
MRRSRTRLPGRSLAVCAALVTAGSLVAGCGGDGDTDPVPATPTEGTVSLTIAAPTSADVPNPDEVTPAAAAQLCDMMRAEVGNWSEQGEVVGRVSFNGTVHNWAVRNGGLNDAVLADQSIIDTATIQECPDVRQQVLDALNLDDLAAGLAGF